MDFIAENSFTITKSLFIEGTLRISRDSYGKFARKAVLVIVGLWVVFFIYTLASGGSIMQAIGFLLITGLAGLWISVGIPRTNARRAWRTLNGKYGNQLQRTTRFYPEYLEVQGNGVERTIPYGEIKDIMQSRRLLILVCADKTGVLVALDGFSAGSLNEVKTLLCSAKNKE